MAIVAYARVSAADQDLTTQIEKLRAAGAERVFAEKRSGNSLSGRSEFEALMAFVREGDEVIMTRIDRCARSMADFQGIITAWKKRGVRFRAIDQAGVVLDGSSTSDLFLNLLMAFAEFETRLRKERQLDGIAAKKAADQSKPRHERTYKGRPRSIDADAVRYLREVEKLGASAIAKRLRIGRASVYRLLDQHHSCIKGTGS
ncbi:recombinase family protein [Methylobacterium dankookense]|uniref:recombinase family protein n=1 Tax=Methylobacterium dankookense TaxID=560405 RepID=UPI0011A81E0C|nr:recombinase family protein [Methylobacterium dankookense]